MRFFAVFAAVLFSQTIFAGAKIRVGSSPVLSSAGIYLAEDEGYFKEQGLDVEITDVANSGAPMTLLLSKNELDVGAGNLSSGLFNAALQGQQFKLVADKGHVDKDHDYIALIVRQDLVDSGRYKSLKDLKGYKMGLTALDGVSQQIVAEKFLKKAGLSDKDVTFVKLSYAEMNTTLKTKGLDATVQLEPFVARAELGKFAKRVAGSNDVHPGQQSAAIIYSPQFMAKRRADGVKFMVAYLKGVRLYNKSLTDPETRKKVRASLGRRMKLDDAVWDKMVPIGLNGDGSMNLKSLDEDLRWYKEKGYLKGELKAAKLADTGFAKEAAKILDGK
jgi:NitT/TauT family transport system substrate-binding protein